MRRLGVRVGRRHLAALSCGVFSSGLLYTDDHTHILFDFFGGRIVERYPTARSLGASVVVSKSVVIDTHELELGRGVLR